MYHVDIPLIWNYSTSISFDDIAEYLSEANYEKYKDKYLRFNVTLKFNNEPGDPDVGINPSFDYQGWSTHVSYPESITKAINEHLLQEPNRYSDEAYEKLCDYIDYLKYGNH